MNSRLRVLLLLPSLHGGGAERLAVHLLNNIDADRFDVRMGLLRKAGRYLEQVDSNRIDAAPYGNAHLNFDRGDRRIYGVASLLLASVLVPWNVRALLRRSRPHVVVSFRKGMSIGTLAGLWLYGRRRVAWIAREGNNTEAVICAELKSPLLRAAIRALTRFCYRRADRVLAVCRGLAEHLERAFQIERHHVATIHNAVDLKRITQALDQPRPLSPAVSNAGQDSLPPGQPYVLFVGRLAAQKQVDVLLHAFARAKSHQDHKLVLAGEGPERAALVRLAEALGVREKVVFVGWQNNPFALMDQAAAFVLPSAWEGFGNVVVEAMACGTPVIVSNCDYGPREIVGDAASGTQAGLIVEAGNISALAEALDRLLSSPQLRNACIQQGQRRCQDFDVNISIRHYEDLFVSAAASMPPRLHRGPR